MQFIYQLEHEYIHTIEDLKLCIEDQASWERITDSWPTGFKLRVQNELATAVEQPFVHKECWIFHQSDYSILRTGDGCENLVDLQSTK